MGKMKELLQGKADEIALELYQREFYELADEQQDEVWNLAEQAVQDYLASLADAQKERRKYEYPKELTQ